MKTGRHITLAKESWVRPGLFYVLEVGKSLTEHSMGFSLLLEAYHSIPEAARESGKFEIVRSATIGESIVLIPVEHKFCKAGQTEQTISEYYYE